MNTASLQRASMFFSPKISLSSFRELTNQTTDPSITPASGDHKKEIKSGWKHFLLWFILLYYCLSSSQQNNRKQQQKRTIKKSPWKLWAVFFNYFLFLFFVTWICEKAEIHFQIFIEIILYLFWRWFVLNIHICS